MAATTTSFTLIKDPAARLDYTWDWTDWLTQVGDTISSATITPTGVTAVGEVVVNGAFVTQRAEGGTLGDLGMLACQITTVSGLIDERTIYLQIQDR
jgi:hypothetical protein